MGALANSEDETQGLHKQHRLKYILLCDPLIYSMNQMLII